MLKLEGNQPKEHNNSNNKAIFSFLLNFLICGYITGTEIMVNVVVRSGGGTSTSFFFPESWRLFSSSYTKKKQPEQKKKKRATLKKGQVCTKDKHNHRTKKIHLKHRCSHLLLILWLSVWYLGLHLVWSFGWVDTMGLFTNIKLSTCLRL